MTFNVSFYDQRSSIASVQLEASEFDSVHQLKSKLCILPSPIASSPDDIYFWIDEKNSPFIKNGKNSNYKGHDIIGVKNINCTTRAELKLCTTDCASWVKDWSRIKSIPLSLDTINNIKKHSTNVTKIESIKIPPSKLKEKFHAHTAILADIIQKKDTINLERLFNKFQLNKNIPICRYTNLDKVQTKIYSPAISGSNFNEKFWARFPSEPGVKQKHLQFKFEFSKCTVYISLNIDGNLAIACHSEIVSYTDEEKWKQIYKNIVNWIIEPINNIIENSIENYSFENLKYRNIITSIYLKKNVNINTDLLEQFYSNIPFFTYDIKNEKKRMKFIKISDYQNSDKRIDIARELFAHGLEENVLVERLGILFMISEKDARSVLSSAASVSSTPPTQLAGNIFHISLSDSNNIRIIYYGKKFNEIEYATNIIRKILWEGRRKTSQTSAAVTKDESLAQEDDEELDAFLDSIDSSEDLVFEDDDILDDDERELDEHTTPTPSTLVDEEVSEDDDDDPTPPAALPSKIKVSKKNNIILPAPPQKRQDIEFDLPPINWDLTKTKAQNVREYRSKRIKYYDPDLYSQVFTLTGEKTSSGRGSSFITSCYPTSAHPIAFNNGEHEEILKRLEDYEKNAGSEIKRILDFKEYRNIWYLSCECICLRCMVPLGEKELLANETCPICKKNDYTIINTKRNPGNFIKLVPQDLIVKTQNNEEQAGAFPCRRKREQKKKTLKAKSLSKKKSTKDIYVLKTTSFPLAKNKLGDLPENMHKMFQNTAQLSYGSLPKIKSEFYLRQGIYDDFNQALQNSFFKTIAWLADLSEQEFKELIIKNLSVPKQLIRTCSGLLLNMFSASCSCDGYTEWLKKYNISDTQLHKKAFTSYKNIVNFINDKDIKHNHTIWWPILCSPGVIWTNGLNLYLFNISISNDGSSKVQYICPYNGEPYYYHYGDGYEKTKTAFITFRYSNNSIVYEPIVKCSYNSKINTKLFDSKDVWESVAPLRIHSGISYPNKYINYLRKNNYIKNPLSYQQLKRILKFIKIKIYAQIINDLNQIKGVLVNYKKYSYYIPVSISSLPNEPKLLILDKIPFDNLPPFNEAISFYTFLKKYNIKSNPLEYTVNYSNNNINGLVLETNDIVPVAETPPGSHNIINLKKSNKTIYTRDRFTSDDDRIKYINKFNKFWSEYDKFVMKISKSLGNRAPDRINTKDLASIATHNDVEKEYLSILLKEFNYNYSRREDIFTSRTPSFLDSLNNGGNDSIIFYDNESKEQYIKNKIEQEKYKKYIPNLDIDNSNIILDKSDYITTNSGTNLPTKWQHILIRDFKYDNLNPHAWITKIAPHKFHKKLIEFQNKYDWLNIANLLNVGIIIFNINSVKAVIPKSNNYKFFILFYNHNNKNYPIFLNRSNKNENNAFNIQSSELSTELLNILGLKGDSEEASSTADIQPPAQKAEAPDDDKTPVPPLESADAAPKTSIKYCKLSEKSKNRKHCVVTNKENENDIDNCIYNDKTKRCNTVAEKAPVAPLKNYCKLSEKAKENKKKHCVNTHIKEENDTESCHYNDKTKRCNTRKHK